MQLSIGSLLSAEVCQNITFRRVCVCEHVSLSLWWYLCVSVCDYEHVHQWVYTQAMVCYKTPLDFQMRERERKNSCYYMYVHWCAVSHLKCDILAACPGYNLPLVQHELGYAPAPLHPCKGNKSSKLNDKLCCLSMPSRATQRSVFWSDAPINRTSSFVCAFQISPTSHSQNHCRKIMMWQR